MEQTGMLRFRPEETKIMRDAAHQAIYDVTGITPMKQEWMSRHGIPTWASIGGMSISQQTGLEELEYFSQPRAAYTALKPSTESDMLGNLNLAWDKVETYAETINTVVDESRQRFLSGSISAKAYLAERASQYDNLRDFVTQKQEDNPLMTMEVRMEWYKESGKTPPIMHPTKELTGLWYGIELGYSYDEFGNYGPDWEKFWSERYTIDQSIPDEYKEDWDEFITRNMNPIDKLQREVYDKYFSKYYSIFDTVADSRTAEEQRLIDEYFALVKSGTGIGRRNEIMAIEDKCGDKLISAFNREVSTNREALRRDNPTLDAWLMYWGKTTSYKSPDAELILSHLCKTTGRVDITK